MARRVTASLVLLLSLSTVALATPLTPHTLSAYFASNPAGPHGRNIRNLECVSRKTQEKGVCMFALSCLKLNGTHLGVCVDRFYYGSCCKMPDSQLDIDLGGGDTNEISPGPSVPLVTAASVLEEESPVSTTKKPEVTTKKPEVTTKQPVTTVKPVQATNKPSPPVTSKPSVTAKPPVTAKPVVATTKPPQVTSKPPVQATTQKATTPKPASVTTSKPSPVTTKRPASKPTPAPTQKPQAATTAKPVPPKPTNTTARPPPKPQTSNKPVATPKPTVKPVTATKPTSKPVVVTTQKPTPPTTVSNEVKPSVRPESPDGPIVEAVEAEEEQTNVVGVTSKPTTTKPKPSPTTAKPSPSTAKPSPSTAKPSPSTVKPTRPTPPTFAPSTARPTPPTFGPTTARPSPPTFPRPSSTSEKPVVTTAATVTTISTTPTLTTTTDGEWVQIEMSTSQSTSGSQVTEEIPSVTRPTSTSSTPTTPQIDIEQNLNMSDYKQVCGRRLFPESRIVGGTRTAFGKWPWQISLRQWRTSTYLHKCGAALLNENWAITAAHCVENVPPSDLLLRLGEHDLSTESEPYSHLERRVQIVASHPQFDSRTFEYDLALLRFYEPVDFKPNVVPICIPDTDKNFVGSNAFVTGWGRLYEDGPLPSVMQEVSVPVLENAACETMYRSAGYVEHIPNIFICAGWKKGGFDSCEGDSGGPMVIQREDNRWVLAGVISWGIGCAEPNQPGVYTRISEFRDWINQILQF